MVQYHDQHTIVTGDHFVKKLTAFTEKLALFFFRCVTQQIGAQHRCQGQ
ncbi:hypothetical protein SRABI106_03530 [Rahnella aquatilis]|nr:hypothetical protein SRABI106_03530 [Rahnella aquatilis]